MVALLAPLMLFARLGVDTASSRHTFLMSIILVDSYLGRTHELMFH